MNTTTIFISGSITEFIENDQFLSNQIISKTNILAKYTRDKSKVLKSHQRHITNYFERF